MAPVDFIASENSMGFHAAQEGGAGAGGVDRLLAAGGGGAQALHLKVPPSPVALPATMPVQGVTPVGQTQ